MTSGFVLTGVPGTSLALVAAGVVVWLVVLSVLGWLLVMLVREMRKPWPPRRAEHGRLSPWWPSSGAGRVAILAWLGLVAFAGSERGGSVAAGIAGVAINYVLFVAIRAARLALRARARGRASA